MSIFFTSDTHYYHTNIIKYCNRPFKDKDEMNHVLIQRWNEVVKPEDTVYHVGDVGFCKEAELHAILDSLNGTKILIIGNHDRVIQHHRKTLFDGKFKAIYDRWMLHDKSLPGQNILLCHYPDFEPGFLHRGGWMLHGHNHGAGHPRAFRMLDVGVDVHDYRPISLETVAEIMSTKVDYDSAAMAPKVLNTPAPNQRYRP